eukprot:3615732-Ditylum_brightwellii.AAC.2
MDTLQDIVKRVVEKSKYQDKSTIRHNGKPERKTNEDPKCQAKKQCSSKPKQHGIIDMSQEETDSNKQAFPSISHTNN